MNQNKSLSLSSWILIIALALGLGISIGWFGGFVAAGLLILLAIIISLSQPRLLVYGLLISIVLGQFGRIPPGAANGAILISDGLAAALFGMWLIWYISRKPLRLPQKPMLLVWSGFLLIAFLLLWANPLALPKKELALNSTYFFRLLFYTALTWIIPALFSTESTLRRLMKWLLGVVMAVVLLGFVQLYILPDIGILAKFGWDPHVGRLVSSFLDPNYLGGFFALGLALFGATLLQNPVKKSGGLWLAIAILLIATVLTFSRSGYLAVVIVALLLGFRFSWKLLLLGLCIVIPISFTLPRVQERIVGGFAVDKTSQDRIDSWERALQIIKEHPVLGVGYNSYKNAQEEQHFLIPGSQGRSVAGSDSSLLTIMATTGVVGVTLFMLSLILLALDAWDIARRTPKTQVGIAALSLLLAGPALLVHSWFVNGLLYPFILLPLCLLIGIMYTKPDAESSPPG